MLQARFLPRFNASVDYYEIDLRDAIDTVGGAQTIVDQCFAGRMAFCDSIVRGPDGHILDIYQQPVNFVSQLNRGIDFELSYRMPLANFVSSWGGDLTFRGMATHYLKAVVNNGLTPPVNVVGQNGGLPDLRYRLSVGYSRGPVSIGLAARGISDGTVNNSWIECNSGCPTSTVENRTIEVGGNHVPGYLYFDSSLAYDVSFGGFGSELFANVRNLLDRDPVRAPVGGGSGTRGNRGTYDGVYDMLGRTFHFGLRMRF